MNMKIFRYFISLALFCISLSSCTLFDLDFQSNEEYEAKKADNKVNMTIWEFIQSRPDIFSSLIEGIQYAGIEDFAGFIDAEHALDPQYAKKIGVDIDNLYISQPDNGEQALEIAETMIRSGALDIVIVDSVAALVPKAEIEGDMDDQQVGLHARLMSKAMRKLTGVINRSNCAVVFINQLREKVGIMFGNPEVTTGGRALKFYSSVRMDVRRVEAIKQGGEIIGNHTKVKVVKNKVAPPFKEAEFDIMFGQGISREGDLIDLAVRVDAVQKSGAWYAYKGEKIGQGRENAKTFLREHPEIMAEVEVQVREYYNLPTDTVVESASQEEGQPKAGDNQNGQFDSITTEE